MIIFDNLFCFVFFFFFKQKTAYEITYGDWSSDVCSSDLSPGAACGAPRARAAGGPRGDRCRAGARPGPRAFRVAGRAPCGGRDPVGGPRGVAAVAPAVSFR